MIMTCVHVLGRRHQGSIHLSRVLLGKLPVWKEIRKALGGRLPEGSDHRKVRPETK